jgi:ribosome maturation factor RimP
MKLSPLEQRITQMIEPVVAEKGLSLVCVRMSGEAGGATLQVFAENPKTRNIGVDDCARLSREIGAILDVENPINGRYRLEISSPGIDRPLMKVQDFIDFRDYEAKVEVFPPMDGQKRFRGYIRGVEGDTMKLETEDQGLVDIDLSCVQKARLVLTDELLKKAKELHVQNTETEKTTETEKQEEA